MVASRLAVIVEGGGRTREGRRKLRAAMRALIGNCHDIIPGGGGPSCIDMLSVELGRGRPALLLMDSGNPVPLPADAGPWQATGKPRPEGATDDHLHLMVTCMEAWVLADRRAIRARYKQQLQESKLPRNPAARTETELCEALKAATSKCSGNRFEKRHTFELLAACDPALIRQCPWADRFFRALEEAAKP